MAHRLKNISVKELTPNDLKRFWHQVDVLEDDECWLWTGTRFKNRLGVETYGSFKLRNIAYVASRISYFIHYEEPGDLFVCHSCDNPPCVNPKHLHLGDNASNQKESILKGRHNFKVQRPASKLTNEQVESIKSSILPTSDLAKMFNVSQSAICRARNRVMK